MNEEQLHEDEEQLHAEQSNEQRLNAQPLHEQPMNEERLNSQPLHEPPLNQGLGTQRLQEGSLDEQPRHLQVNPVNNLSHPVNERQQYRLAGFWTRLLAYGIDIIAIASISSIVVTLFHTITNVDLDRFAWYGVSAGALGIVGFTYFAVLTGICSQTIGKMLMGIQVVRQDGRAMDWATALIREVPGRTISQLFGSYIGYIWIAFHPDKRGWHDMFCDTYVVYCNEIEGRKWITMAIDNGKY